MEELINFAVNLMERENRHLGDPDLLPSQNPQLNPSQNIDLNISQNRDLNTSQNPDINRTQNPNWKQNQWVLFKETILWESLNDSQKKRCSEFLKQL